MSDAEAHATPDERHVISREAELLALRRFLESRGPARCLVLSGEAGIGKTTLWEAGIDAAIAQRYTVLSARSSRAEVAMSFAALADLIDGIDPDALASLPAPQLQALEVALRRRDPVGAASDPFAISAGFLTALRLLAARAPLLVAIDDVDALDSPSADAVDYAARRLSDGRTRLLVTRRSGRRSRLEAALEPAAVEVLEITPLTFGATRRMLADRLGATITRRVLRRVHETSHGNPLFALELGRMLAAGGAADVGAELPVPDVVDDIFGPRVQGLPDPLRHALLAVSLSAGMSRSEVSTVVDPLALEDAIASGLLVVDRSRVRPTHPMLAVAARRHSTARERRDLHMDLGAAVSDATLRARHLAIATAGQDADLAAVVAAAAQLAASRGAVHDAEELGAHALRLTPRQAPERTDRLLALARFHLYADDMTQVTDLLTAGMGELPPGRPRAIAHLLLGEAADFEGNRVHAEIALVEGAADPEVRALALAKRSKLLTLSAVERIDEAEAWALEAVSAAAPIGGEVEDRAQSALAWARVLRGHPIDDLVPAEPVSRRPWIRPDSSIDGPRGGRLASRGQMEEGRALFHEVLALADERGDLQVCRIMQQKLCELELRAGNVHEAARRLDELDEGPHWMGAVRARLHAVLSAVTGIPTAATRWAAVVMDTGSGDAQGWDRLEATRAVGVAALLERDTATAIESLRSVWEHTLREHVDDPGAFPAGPDLVEALVESGDTDAARTVTQTLRQAAADQRHPWGLASAKRCEAVLQMSDTYLDGAAGALLEAAAEYGGLGLNFDRARTLLVLGGIQRRFKKRARARDALEQAAAQFDQCGCTGWAELARAELARVSGRRSLAEDQLTASERQVVTLAASGLSNKEIASKLSVTVYTVEAHLTHAYAKLGVRSRAQLVRILSDTAPP
jgi:DNA-binding CsgD family transcriptional regulator